ncbi:MAG: channel protein TolC, partial [Proteobacteria bacterium]|nr:channel protein TolC [Pseudomonadota bacterium]
SSGSALESNKLGYDVGVRINIDVLNAQQQLYSTERDLAKAAYDTLLAQLRLKSAAGTLGEEDVQALNALLAQ